MPQKAELVEQVEKCKKSSCDWQEKFLVLSKEVQLNEEKISDMEDVIVRLKADVIECQNIGDSYKQRSEVGVMHYYKTDVCLCVCNFFLLFFEEMLGNICLK